MREVSTDNMAYNIGGWGVLSFFGKIRKTFSVYVQYNKSLLYFANVPLTVVWPGFSPPPFLLFPNLF